MKKSLLSAGLVLSVLCVLLLGTSSCDKNEETNLYTIIYKWGSAWSTSDLPPSDYDKMKTYIESKGCSTKKVDLMYSGASKAENDTQAKAEFDKYVSKLSKEEAAKLGLKKDAGFGFVLSRGGEMGKDETEDIATWSYQQQ